VQVSPLKQKFFGHSQIFTSWLYSGAQPQGPTGHKFGKLLTALQHNDIDTVPPELMQLASFSESS